MIKYTLRGLLFAFIIIVLQTTILTNLYFLPILPDLLLIFILFISFFDGPIIGMTVAFLAGFIFDAASLSPFGLNSFYLVQIAFFMAELKKSFAARSIFLPCFTTLMATFFKALIFFVLAFFYGKSIKVYDFTNYIFWGELLLNVILAPFLFKFFGLFDTFLKVPFRESLVNPKNN